MSILVIGASNLALKVTSKFTGAIKDKIFEKAAEKVLDKLTGEDLKIGEMSEEEYRNLMHNLIMETREYSPNEADRITQEIIQDTGRMLGGVSDDILHLAKVVDDSLDTLVSNVNEQMALELQNLKNDMGRHFIQQRKHEKAFMTKFNDEIQKIIPIITAEAEKTRIIVKEEHEKTRSELKQEIRGNAAKLDQILTHFGISPEIGTKSIVRMEDKPSLRQAVQSFEEKSSEDMSYLDPKMLIKTGLAHRELGEHIEAIRYYRASIKIEESNRAFFHMGFDLSVLGRYEEALDAYEKALQLNPKDTSAWTNKGAALSYLGRSSKALKAYEEALKREPNDPITLYNIACAYSRHLIRDSRRRNKISRTRLQLRNKISRTRL